MKAYEIIFLVKPTAGEEGYQKSVELVQKYIEETEGKVDSVDKWGVKPLPTVFDHFDKAYFTYMQFHATNATLEELQHRLSVSEDIFRHMIVTKDSVETHKDGKRPERIEMKPSSRDSRDSRPRRRES